ncbi:nitrilase-related carbon-nitrogen hydrolase [Chloroflexota bacterium]
MDAKTEKRKAIAPYAAIGLCTTKQGISKRSDCMVNLKNIRNNINAAMFIASTYFPVKIIALAEGAIQGFTDEAFDINHVTFARELAIDIPGEETDFLGELAKQNQTYIIAQAKAKLPEVIKDRFFNIAFIIDPTGKVIHRYVKNHVFARERSCVPHDIYDIWVKKFGDGIDAFYPVCKTEDIGNIGLGVCMDGMFPEWSRALALNGAEVIYRPNTPQPFSGSGLFVLQNRAHAMFNNCYLVAPAGGPYYLHPGTQYPSDISGGNAHIVDYEGRIINFSTSGTDTFVAAIIDIEKLRHFREMSLVGNWVKDLRMETFKRMYEKPIHPKNLWVDKEPLHHAEHDEIYRDNIRRLQEGGVYTPPAEHFDGAKYIHPVQDPEKRTWEEIRKLWE